MVLDVIPDLIIHVKYIFSGGFRVCPAENVAHRTSHTTGLRK